MPFYNKYERICNGRGALPRDRNGRGALPRDRRRPAAKGGARSRATVCASRKLLKTMQRQGRGALLRDRLRIAQTIIDTFSARSTCMDKPRHWHGGRVGGTPLLRLQVAQERAPPVRVLRTCASSPRDQHTWPRPAMTAGRGKRALAPSFPPSLSFLKSAGLRPFRPDGLADFSKDASFGTKAHRPRGRQRTRKP